MISSIMRFLLLSALFLALQTVIHGQCTPLVPNGGFEEYSSLPNDDCGWALATGWTNAATSSDCNTNNGTPDYFHLQGTGEFASLPINYFSELNPFEGEAVMGLGGYIDLQEDGREYISIELSSPLVVGNEYTVSFSMTIGTPQVGGYYTDGWGLILTTGPVLQPVGTNDPIIPTGNQFIVPGVFTSETWETYSFTFIADQPFNQLTFGNFFTDLEQNPTPYGTQGFISLAYVFVDDFQIQDLNFAEPVVDLGPDFELCQNQVTLDATTAGALSYLWNNGATTSTLNINSAGLYYVDVEWECGVVRDSIVVSSCPQLIVELGPDILICPGEIVTLQATVIGGAQPYNFEWSINNSANSSSITISPQTTNTVTLFVTDAIGNTASDELLVTVAASLFNLDLGPDDIICPGETISLDASVIGADSYDWSNGSSSNTIQITEPGIYFVEASSECASLSDTITFTSGLAEIPEFANEVSLCDGKAVEIGPSFEDNQNVQWLDDSSNSFPRSVNQQDLYEFSVTDECGVRSFEIDVNSSNCECKIYVPNSFTPNDDGTNDYFAPEFKCEFTSYDFRVYNRWGDEIFRSTDPDQKWIGNAENQSKYFVPDGLYVWTLNAESNLSGDNLQVYSLTGSILLFR